MNKIDAVENVKVMYAMSIMTLQHKLNLREMDHRRPWMNTARKDDRADRPVLKNNSLYFLTVVLTGDITCSHGSACGESLKYKVNMVCLLKTYTSNKQP